MPASTSSAPALSALGLGLMVYGVLRSGTWGFVQAQAGRAHLVGPVAGDLADPRRRRRAVRLPRLGEAPTRHAAEPALLDPAILRVRLLRSGLIAFFFQYLLQAGLFFAVPLFLSIALGLSAIQTGVRILPLSITLVIAAVGIPKLFPQASPRRVSRLGFLVLFLGLVVFVAALDAGAGPEIVTWPMILAGLGIGALASQLGAVTVSALPDEQSGEVGGLQNTFSNLGISIGTALAGAVLMSALTASLPHRHREQPGGPQGPLVEGADRARRAASRSSPTPTSKPHSRRPASPAPPPTAIVDENAEARLDALRASLSVLAILALIALFLSGSIPTTPVGAEQTDPDPIRLSERSAS